MNALGNFIFFNVGTSLSDVVTDFLTFSYLLDGNPNWASVTLLWTFMPCIVRTAFYVYKKARGQIKSCDTWGEFCKEIYNESISHLPLISTLNNLWRAKRLFDLNYGSDKFNMSDHAEVEKILADAGRTSEGESNFESGPQAVTQVSNK